MRALISFLTVFFILTFSVYGNEMQTESSTQIIDFDNLDFGTVDEHMQKYDFSFKNTVKNILTGKWDISLNGLKSKAFDIFISEVKNSLGFIKSIAAVCLLTGILSTAAKDLKGKEVQNTVFYVSCIFVLGGIVMSYNECVSIVRSVVNEITQAIGATVPLIIAVTSAGGSIDILSPVLLTITDINAVIVESILLPLLMSSFIVKILNSLSDESMLGKLSDLLTFIITCSIKMLSIAFMFWVSFERISSYTAGSFISKTTAAAVKMVPVVGGVLSGGADIITGSIAAVKNGLGLTAVIFIIICCAVPVIKLLTIALLYRAAAAVTEPIADKRITEMVDSFGKTVWLMLSILFSIVFMYITAMIILLCSAE